MLPVSLIGFEGPSGQREISAEGSKPLSANASIALLKTGAGMGLSALAFHF